MVSGTFCIPFDVRLVASRSAVAEQGKPEFPLNEYVGDASNSLVRFVSDENLLLRPQFNPLVFVGPRGTGKSFLACGLASHWMQRHPHWKVVIAGGSDFARCYAAAIEANSLDDLRSRFRRAHLLVLDALDELAEKRTVQIELLQTIDALVLEQRRIIITLREFPKSRKAFHAGLTSRLSNGLTIPLNAPGKAARLEILAKLIRRHQLEFDQAALSVLAERLRGTVPELNNAVTQLSRRISDGSCWLGSDVMHCYLRDQPFSNSLPLSSIAMGVAKYFRQKVTTLRGPSRRQAVVRARAVAMYLSRELTTLSLDQIGAHYGHRDHSTVLHACRKIRSLLKTDNTIRQAVDELCQSFDIS